MQNPPYKICSMFHDANITIYLQQLAVGRLPKRNAENTRAMHIKLLAPDHVRYFVCLHKHNNS
jgi:hypothetical protein